MNLSGKINGQLYLVPIAEKVYSDAIYYRRNRITLVAKDKGLAREFML